MVKTPFDKLDTLFDNIEGGSILFAPTHFHKPTVYSGNRTSAVVDAMYFNLRIIIYYNPDICLTQCDLRGI